MHGRCTYILDVDIIVVGYCWWGWCDERAGDPWFLILLVVDFVGQEFVCFLGHDSWWVERRWFTGRFVAVLVMIGASAGGVLLICGERCVGRVSSSGWMMDGTLPVVLLGVIQLWVRGNILYVVDMVGLVKVVILGALFTLWMGTPPSEVPPLNRWFSGCCNILKRLGDCGEYFLSFPLPKYCIDSINLL